jgi:hypothetical protein
MTLTWKSRVWRFLNSPFGIWLMSTVVIGSATTLLTERHSCISDTDALAEQYYREYIETKSRLKWMADAALSTTTWDEVKEVLAQRGTSDSYTISEFKDETLDELVLKMRAHQRLLGISQDPWARWEAAAGSDGMQGMLDIESYIHGDTTPSTQQLFQMRATLKKIYDRDNHRLTDEAQIDQEFWEAAYRDRCSISRIVPEMLSLK